MRVCKHEGCPRPVKSLGYCASHYQQFRMRGYTTDIVKTKNTKPDEFHIKRENDRLEEIEKRRRERKRKEFGPCVAPGCDKQSAVAKSQECAGHYQQRLSGRPYTDLIQWSERQDRNAETRRCNGCLRIKNTQEGFYVRRNGTPQNECKICFGFRARYNRLNLEGRTDEAKAQKVEWDEYVAEGRSEAQKRA